MALYGLLQIVCHSTNSRKNDTAEQRSTSKRIVNISSSEGLVTAFRVARGEFSE